MANDRSSSSDAQIKKGILEICVLHMISEKPTYGYDVMKNIKKYFPEVNESTVYAILRRLHSDKCAGVTISGESGGPPRKYYHITEEGSALLKSNIASWQRVNSALIAMGINQ
jgi:PadR family transcriptional regulator PadR